MFAVRRTSISYSMLTLCSLDIAIHILLPDSGRFAGGHDVDVERWPISKRRTGMRRLKRNPMGQRLLAEDVGAESCWLD